MKFKDLSLFLEELEKNSSRIKITEILARLFRKSGSDEIDKVCYLVLGQLKPKYEGIVFSLAEKLIVESIALAFSVSREQVVKAFKEKGDLGDVSFSLNKERRIEDLSVSEVYNFLLKVALDSGEGSQDRKIKNFAEILSSVDPLSSKFITRIPLGKLRLGFSDKTILDALSWMEIGDKSKKTTIEKAYQVIPDVGLLAKKIKEVGIEKACREVKPIVGVPVLPMLAQRLKSPKEMVEKMGKVFVEPKFDGLRVLIHFRRSKKGDSIWAFTRNLNNVYQMFPELKEVGKYVDANEVILDTEAVGMDPKMKRLAEFQVTMQRRRKYEIEKKRKEIPVKFEVFDILYKDGESLMDIPYYKRRKVLKETVKSGKLLAVDEAIETDNPDVINSEYRGRIKEGLEGVIVKRFDTPYVPGRTGWRWVKMKEEETAVGKLADTIDCVVMGYYAGRGKRARFGMGGFLVGVVDNDVIKTVTKVGTGLTDEQFKEMYKRLKELETNQKPKEYGEVNKVLIPDFWVVPSLVVEVAADEITKSPVHSSGLALRFPRLVCFRDDKGPDQATTLSEVRKLYKFQGGRNLR